MGLGHIYLGERGGEGFLSCSLLLLSVGDGEDSRDKLIYWSIETMFLGGVKTAIRSGMESRFGTMGF